MIGIRVKTSYCYNNININCILNIIHFSNSQEVFKDEINPPQPEATDFNSVTMKDFNKPEFVHQKPAPTRVYI